MTSWHGINPESKEYDEIQQQAIKAKPVDGAIKDTLGAATYCLRFEPLKGNFMVGAIVNGHEVLYAPLMDPLSSGLWVNVPGVSRGPIEGEAKQYTGTYAHVAAHAKRLNDMEAQKTGGPSHIFSLDLLKKEAA